MPTHPPSVALLQIVHTKYLKIPGLPISSYCLHVKLGCVHNGHESLHACDDVIYSDNCNMVLFESATHKMIQNSIIASNSASLNVWQIIKPKWFYSFSNYKKKSVIVFLITFFGNCLWEQSSRTVWKLSSETVFENCLRELSSGTVFGNCLRKLSSRTYFRNCL